MIPDGSPRRRIGPWVVVCALLLACCGCGRDEPGARAPLLCYVGGTMRPAVEELLRTYEQRTGQKVEIDYGDSGSNLVKIETQRRGDLYVAHDPFLAPLMNKGLGTAGWTVASLTPVIVVAKGNPEGIRGIEDLAREGLRLGLTDPEFSTLGHICPVIFDRAGLRAKIEANVETNMRMGGQVANAVAVGNLDAAIVWNAVAHLRADKLDVIDISPRHLPDPDADAVTSATFGTVDMSHIKVFVATLESSKQPEAARACAAFMASPEGEAVFARYGFSPARKGGPSRATTAARTGETLRLYCGAGLRPAMAEVVQAFEARTGIVVECDYAGSGMLMSRVKLQREGDLFMPGDVWYLDQIAEEGMIASRQMVTYFVPVIIVAKGNPKGIRGPADLARPGVRLALGNPEACQIGRITEKVLIKNAVDMAAVRENLVFHSVTVNELGLQIKTGRADAAVVWDAIAAYYADSADTVRIPLAQNKVSRVALGVLEFSEHKEAAERFVAFAAGDEGKAIFRKHNYQVEPPE